MLKPLDDNFIYSKDDGLKTLSKYFFRNERKIYAMIALLSIELKPIKSHSEINIKRFLIVYTFLVRLLTSKFKTINRLTI